MSTGEITAMIEEDLKEKRAREKMEMAATTEKDEAASTDRFEIGAIEDKKLLSAHTSVSGTLLKMTRSIRFRTCCVPMLTRTRLTLMDEWQTF